MKITKNKVVTLDYTVTNTDGQVIDDGRNPIVYLHGGYDDTFPLIEKALNDKKVGDRVSVTLKPKDAFGEYNNKLVTSEKASLLPKNVKVGMSFKRVYENGEEEKENIIVARDNKKNNHTREINTMPCVQQDEHYERLDRDWRNAITGTCFY